MILGDLRCGPLAAPIATATKEESMRRVTILLIAGALAFSACSSGGGAAPSADGPTNASDGAPPPGGLIVFKRGTAAGWRLYTTKPDGAAMKPLVPTPPGAYDQHASWSPDGSRVVFA